MERSTYDQLVAQSIEEAVNRLLPNGGGIITEGRLRAALDVLSQRVAAHTRAYELLNIRTADELAEQWGVSVRRVQALIKRRHERFGIGRKIGIKWVVSAEEAKRIEPDAKYRRKPHE